MGADLDEDEVELVEVHLLAPHLCLVRRRLDNHTDDKVPDPWGDSERRWSARGRGGDGKATAQREGGRRT